MKTRKRAAQPRSTASATPWMKSKSSVLGFLGVPLNALHFEDGVLNQMEKIGNGNICLRERPDMVLLVLFIKTVLIHSSI